MNRLFGMIVLALVLMKPSALLSEDLSNGQAARRNEEHEDRYNTRYEESVCQDEDSSCKGFLEKGFCRLKIIQRKCKSTCGMCAASPPLHCGLTKYGCCWDNQTQANNSNKEGCPACKDKFELCKFFQEECPERRDIRLLCPISCGIKCNTCRDSDHQKAMCPSYKKFGFCEVSPDLMKQICARTCNFCPL